jgi:serine/threonine protein kinase
MKFGGNCEIGEPAHVLHPVGMQPPELNSLEVFDPLGAGACGRVYRARDASGELVAVKVMDPAAVNRALLEEMALRLEDPAWPEGTLPERAADYRGKQIIRITRFLGDETGGSWVPRSLQHRLERFPGEDSWSVVLEILRALAAMHERQVPHGNLKPGNVFFDDAGKIVLTDWALGNMPGIANLEYTDAILYQPPDQLRESQGYLQEKGYRWDVFAFGVLAFRLLTGAFPRCTETFDQVAPDPGKTRRDGIAANLKSVAKSIESKPDFAWPDPPANSLEKSYRGIIDRCLVLDHANRPANAGAVIALFHAADRELAVEQQRDAVLDQHRRARRSAWRANVAAGILAGGVAILSILYQMKRSAVSAEEAGRQGDIRRLEGMLAESGNARSTIEADLATTKTAAENERRELQYEKDRWLARLEASQATADHLFTWAMEKGHRNLPPLDGREVRLSRLERYFQDFITRNADLPDLKEERARARLQLAEVSLAKGDPKLATTRLEEALASSSDLPSGPDLELRLATDRLLLALLLQDRNDETTPSAFATARKALEAVPQAEVDADRVQELIAILDINESRLMAATGRDNEAYERLQRATKVLNDLVDQRPDHVVLRSELASCYLSSATILDGIGQMGDAREARAMAADGLLALLKEEPSNLDLRLDLAGCYGAMAEAAITSADVAGAESMSRAAVKLLEELIVQRPESPEVRSRLAAQRCLMSGIVRDRGNLSQAHQLMDEGLQLIEAIAVGDSADHLAKYRYALLLWQKGRLVGFDERFEEEINLETKAAEILRKLVDSDYGLVRAEQVKRSLGLVLGDLGLAAHRAQRMELARAAYGEAVATWSILCRERPQNQEYEECLASCQERLDGL